MKRSLMVFLAAALFLTTSVNTANAEIKKIKKSKDEYTVKPIDIIKEFPPEEGAFVHTNTNVNTKEQVKVYTSEEDLKEELVIGKKEKGLKKSKKIDYSEYLIPVDNFTVDHVGHSHHSNHISGSVETSMSLNLADCLELALVNNPKIKASYFGAAAEKSKHLQTIANYSPRVNLSTGFSRIKPDSGTSDHGIDPFSQYLMGNIGIKQLVYDFGYTQNEYSINKLGYEAAKENIDATVNDIICSVKDAFYYLLLMIENERVVKESVEYFEQTYNQARAFWEIGTKAKIDVTIAQVNLESARADLIAAQCDVDLATARLNNAMGLPFIPPYKMSEKLPFEKASITIREAVEIANKSRPELKIALLSVKTADEYVKLAKKSFLPEISLEGNWTRGKIQDEDGRGWYDVGAYLSFPTINPLLIKGQVNEAKHLYSKQQYDAKSTVNDIYYDIQQAYDRVMDTQVRIPVAELAVNRAQETFLLAKGRYRVGEGDAIELKDAQLQLQKSQLAHNGALYEFNSAKANLERAMGQTLKSGEVNKPKI